MTRIIAHRAANGLETCSPNTASYCNARGRLPTGVLRTLARRTAAELQAAAAEDWKWNGREVFIADGSCVSMPDTPENRAIYPQPPTQQPGIGFPMARVQSCGARDFSLFPWVLSPVTRPESAASGRGSLEWSGSL